MDEIMMWVAGSVEMRNWGLNAATSWAFGANVFTLFQAWAIRKQTNTMRAAEKTGDVFLPLFIFFLGYCLSFIYYGWVTKSITMVLNGMLAIVFAELLWVARKCRRFTAAELATLLAVPAMVVLMVLSSMKTAVLMLYLAIIFASLLGQPLKIKQERKVDQVDIRFQYVFIGTSVFWICYAASLPEPDVAILTFNPAAIVVYIWTILLYRKYRVLALIEP